MHLTEFLKKISQPGSLQSQVVFSFKGSEYPLFFFSRLMQKITALHGIVVQKIDLVEADPASVKSQLAMSFLGEHYLYWLGNLADLEGKKKQAWLALASTYTGPHKLAFFVDEEAAATGDFIELPPAVDQNLYEELFTFLKQEKISKALVKKIMARGEKISLDTACLLFEYQAVVGAGTEQFFEHWFSKLVSSEKSLFILSQHFFAKAERPFTELWQGVRADYPDVFWVTFWSEQLWRAHYVVKCLQEKNLVEAKKISFRLPFSFMQRDWRKVSLRELSAAHQRIYDLDFALKNGASETGLDLFFVQFFAGTFNNQETSPL